MIMKFLDQVSGISNNIKNRIKIKWIQNNVAIPQTANTWPSHVVFSNKGQTMTDIRR